MKQPKPRVDDHQIRRLTSKLKKKKARASIGSVPQDAPPRHPALNGKALSRSDQPAQPASYSAHEAHLTMNQRIRSHSPIRPIKPGNNSMIGCGQFEVE
jgi:hypothetical protein